MKRTTAKERRALTGVVQLLLNLYVLPTVEPKRKPITPARVIAIRAKEAA